MVCGIILLVTNILVVLIMCHVIGSLQTYKLQIMKLALFCGVFLFSSLETTAIFSPKGSNNKNDKGSIQISYKTLYSEQQVSTLTGEPRPY